MKDWANSGEMIHSSIKCTIFYSQNKLLFLLLISISVVVVVTILLFMYNLQRQSWHGERLFRTIYRSNLFRIVLYVR